MIIPATAMTRYYHFFSFAVFLLVSFATTAQEAPYFSGYVNDDANLLNESTQQTLEDRLRDHEQRTTNQVTVLTIESLNGMSIEDYSLSVAEPLKIGQDEKDNGILLLVARDDREMRIEVGYGLEPYLSDAYASRIIREVIAPRFRDNDFDGGIESGSERYSRENRGYR